MIDAEPEVAFRGRSCGNFRSQPIAGWLRMKDGTLWLFLRVSFDNHSLPPGCDRFYGQLIYRREDKPCPSS